MPIFFRPASVLSLYIRIEQLERKNGIGTVCHVISVNSLYFNLFVFPKTAYKSSLSNKRVLNSSSLVVLFKKLSRNISLCLKITALSDLFLSRELMKPNLYSSTGEGWMDIG
jgi:hypothetical protein